MSAYTEKLERARSNPEIREAVRYAAEANASGRRREFVLARARLVSLVEPYGVDPLSVVLAVYADLNAAPRRWVAPYAALRDHYGV